MAFSRISEAVLLLLFLVRAKHDFRSGISRSTLYLHNTPALLHDYFQRQGKLMNEIKPPNFHFFHKRQKELLDFKDFLTSVTKIEIKSEKNVAFM